MSHKAVSALLFLALTAGCDKEGPKGDPGEKGDSSPGLVGQDGSPGRDGKDGTNGKDGANGKDGVDGTTGAKGEDLRTIELKNLVARTDRDGALLTNFSKSMSCSVELRTSDGRLPKDARLVMNIVADDKVRVANLPTTMIAPGSYESTWNWDAALIGKAKSVQCSFQLIGTEALIADQISARLPYLNEETTEYALGNMTPSMENIDGSWYLMLTPNDSDRRQPTKCKAEAKDAFGYYMNRETTFDLNHLRNKVYIASSRGITHARLLRVDISCGTNKNDLWVTLEKDQANVTYYPVVWQNPHTHYAYFYLNAQDGNLPIFPVVPPEATRQVTYMVEQVFSSSERIARNLGAMSYLGPRFINLASIHQLGQLVKTDDASCKTAFAILDQVAQAQYNIDSGNAQSELEQGLEWTFKNGQTCRSNAFRYGFVYNKIPDNLKEEANTVFQNNLNSLKLEDWSRLCSQGPSIWQEKFLNSDRGEATLCRLRTKDKVEDTAAVAKYMSLLVEYGMTWETIKSRVKDPAKLMVDLFRTGNLRYVTDLRKEDLSQVKTFIEYLAANPSDAGRGLIRGQWQRLAPAVEGASPTLQAFLLEMTRNRPVINEILIAANSSNSEYLEFFTSLTSQPDLKLQLDGFVGRLAIEKNDAAYQTLLKFVQDHERMLDSSSLTNLGRILPYVGAYKTAVLENLILPYVFTPEFCHTDVLQAIRDLSIKSEQVLDFVQSELKSRSTCSMALKAAIALGRDAWKDRAPELLNMVQQAKRFESATWVRPAALLFHLGFYTETLQKLVLEDLATFKPNLDFYTNENSITTARQISELALETGELNPYYYENGPSASPLMSLLYSIGPRADFVVSPLFEKMSQPLMNKTLEMQVGFVLSQMQKEYRPIVFRWLIESQYSWSREAAYYFAEP